MSEKKCKLGLVTVLYNNTDVLDDFFKSLALQKGIGFTTYIVDNSDNTTVIDYAKTLAKQYKINVVFYKSEQNVGVAAGNNRGLKLAFDDGCDILCLINNDLIFTEPNLLLNLASQLDKYDLVSPSIEAYPSGKLWFSGGHFDLLRGTTPHNGFIPGRHIPYAPTCFLMCKKDVFDKIGTMDEWYFAYYDDSDFVYRAYQAGFHLGFANELLIQHKVSSSTGGSESDFCIYYGNRNRIYFIKKNLGKVTPMIYTILSRLLLLLKVKAKQRTLLLRAIRDGLKAKPE